MKNKKHNYTNKSTLLLVLLILVISAGLFVSAGFLLRTGRFSLDKTDTSEVKSYHILVLGKYENEMFLKKLYEGAQKHSQEYNALIELYVPSSQAEDVSLQSIFDYAAFVNADGIISYIENMSEKIERPFRIDGSQIPVVTTGQYSSILQQISYIGNSYWELGKKFADEIVSNLDDSGVAYIISSDAEDNPYYSNLTNSMQAALKEHGSIEYSVVDSISADSDFFKSYSRKEFDDEKKTVFVCFKEEETIRAAQDFMEYGFDKKNNISLIGYGNNETIHLFLNKNVITEVLSVDPSEIGETAIHELFEYRNKGYANSYIAADIKVTRSERW